MHIKRGDARIGVVRTYDFIEERPARGGSYDKLPINNKRLRLESKPIRLLLPLPEGSAIITRHSVADVVPFHRTIGFPFLAVFRLRIGECNLVVIEADFLCRPIICIAAGRPAFHETPVELVFEIDLLAFGLVLGTVKINVGIASPDS